MNIRQIGLSTSAFGYSMGVVGKNTDRKSPNPWTLDEFVEFADKHGLGGVEAPLMRFVPNLEASRLETLGQMLSDREVFFLMDAEGTLDVEEIKKLIPLAKKFSSPIIRIKTSNILECARKKFVRPWTEHVEHCISVLRELAPKLREASLRIAVENHQDLDSNDLLKIVESVGPDVVGVNFDIGNAFSVCENPFNFAEKLGKYIINIHLKDYKLFKSEEGFRLVRCSLGEGSVDFRTILPELARNSPDAKMVVELGALEARNIAWLEPGFWKEIEPRTDSERAAFSQLLEREIIGTALESWKTPWEQGASALGIISYETRELETSLNYLSNI